MKLPSEIDLQELQDRQGFADNPSSQFKHFVSIRAMVVLPTPLVPVNK